ncbi:MAG: hypothetical protein IPF66_18645 [Holophagales bacterium]|nr:hypothetical protein [Holophagales bacterium]
MEPYLTTRMQGWFWSAGYVVFVLLSGAVLLLTSRAAGPGENRTAAPENQVPQDTERHKAAGKREKHRKERRETAPLPDTAGSPVTWFLLSATAVTLLLGVTNRMSQDIAAILSDPPAHSPP